MIAATDVREELTLSPEVTRISKGLLDGSPEAERNAKVYLGSVLRPLFGDAQRRGKEVEKFLEKLKTDTAAEQEPTITEPPQDTAGAAPAVAAAESKVVPQTAVATAAQLSTQ